jgi:hypothetical protein
VSAAGGSGARQLAFQRPVARRSLKLGTVAARRVLHCPAGAECSRPGAEVFRPPDPAHDGPPSSRAAPLLQSLPGQVHRSTAAGYGIPMYADTIPHLGHHILAGLRPVARYVPATQYLARRAYCQWNDPSPCLVQEAVDHDPPHIAFRGRRVARYGAKTPLHAPARLGRGPRPGAGRRSAPARSAAG